MKTHQLTSQHLLIIGQNAKENHDIIKNSNPSDLWFHVSNYPSAHVILQPSSKKSKLIYQAALASKLRSKAAKFPNVQMVYTPVENLIPTSKPGEVTFKSQKLLKYINV